MYFFLIYFLKLRGESVNKGVNTGTHSPDGGSRWAAGKAGSCPSSRGTGSPERRPCRWRKGTGSFRRAPPWGPSTTQTPGDTAPWTSSKGERVSSFTHQVKRRTPTGRRRERQFRQISKRNDVEHLTDVHFNIWRNTLLESWMRILIKCEAKEIKCVFIYSTNQSQQRKQ